MYQRRTIHKKLRFALLSMLFSVALCLSASAATKVPVLMYHNLSTAFSDVNSMTITVARFRQDMEYLAEYGYTALLPADLVNIKAGTKPMPLKPVMITFDDGYASNYNYAYPIMKETGTKAVISVVASNIGSSSHMLTWKQCQEMYQSGYVDIGTHTYNLHNPQTTGNYIYGGVNGIERKKGEKYSAYTARVGSDIAKSVSLIESKVGNNCIYFSYPYGEVDRWIGQILLDNGIFISTTTKQESASISGSGLYGLPRYHMTMSQSTGTLFRHSATAVPAVSRTNINGKTINLPSFRIGGENYVKLRDIAWLLNSTNAAFSVGWVNNKIVLHSGQHYTAVGGELVTLGTTWRSGAALYNPLSINNTDVLLAAYNIGGNYYFRLRSLGKKLNFNVGWDSAQRTVVVETK